MLNPVNHFRPVLSSAAESRLCLTSFLAETSCLFFLSLAREPLVHLRILHFFLWTVSGHGMPPNWGSSLTIRERIMWPFPQDLLHSDHDDHSDSMQSVAGGGMMGENELQMSEALKKSPIEISCYQNVIKFHRPAIKWAKLEEHFRMRSLHSYSRHSGSMHFSTCSSSSGHKLGSTGVFSIRWRDRMPIPQDTLHSLHSDHGDSIHTTASTVHRELKTSDLQIFYTK